MGNFIDLTGKRFGSLTVIERFHGFTDPSGRKRTMWTCLCDCGTRTVVNSDTLRRGTQVSCGCYRRKHTSELFKRHGKTGSRLYTVWCGIKNRCYNPNAYEYKFYGARNIKMCDEWRCDFQSFYDWAIENGYDDSAKRGECEIDRIDGSYDYCPNNCRITTRREQMNNIRTNRIIECNGDTHTLSVWSRITGISSSKIRNRIVQLGWSSEQALEITTA